MVGFSPFVHHQPRCQAYALRPSCPACTPIVGSKTLFRAGQSTKHLSNVPGLFRSNAGWVGPAHLLGRQHIPRRF